ncbi:NosD domain-containing protein [Microbulbifer sp. ANSA005]|uniref:NosD domain-containing protein n=1 Tax=Microbulbifer sp. ANSA005 TaxID=3243362 RepID=UPI0040410870
MKSTAMHLTSVTILIGTLAVPIVASAVSCGDVITTSETLTEDLSCDSTIFNPSLTIEGPSGRLDMGGYTLMCVNATGDGILLTGTAARLSNGDIQECFDSIQIEGTGSHRVSTINIIDSDDDAIVINSSFNTVTDTSSFNTDDDGIDIGSSSNSNIITNNIIDTVDDEGIELDGDGNFISGNEILNTEDGIDLDGSFNVVVLNTIDSNDEAGIELRGEFTTVVNNSINNNNVGIEIYDADNNTITGNEASVNTSYGIYLLDLNATQNVIVSNTAIDNGIFDLFSPLDLDCSSSNVWAGNIFVTSDPACLD